MRRFVVVLIAAIAASSCSAHWTEQPDLPDWAQRGTLNWSLHYSRANRELVDLFADGHQTLIHGGSFDSEETGDYAEQLGLRYMPYVCSRTLTTTNMEQSPELQQAVMLKEDRSEFLAYNNPVRRYGSLHPDTWPNYVRERIQRVREFPNVWAIFFDNAFAPQDDHRDENVAAWQAWARERGIDPGDDVPYLYQGEQAAQSRAFSRDALIDYHRGLQQYCHAQDPPLLNCPNSGNDYGLAALEAGVLDLMFYENGRHAPFFNNAFLYKKGLAASHGKPTAMLSYIPESVGDKRGVRTWHEGMHHFFYPSSPHAEEFAVAIAEAASVGGNYVTCYSLFPALPITDTTDPFNQRIYREIKRMYTFLDINSELYAGAQPGSDVAVLYSSDTGLQNRHLANYDALGEAITHAGIPYEVVVPSDLTGDGMTGVRTLLLPNVLYISEAAVAGALKFVQDGGRAIITGDFATYNEDGVATQSAAAAELLAPLGLVSRAVREWELDGFEPESIAQIKAVRDGATASMTFDGVAGDYVAHIAMTDENDGTSAFELAAAGRTVFEGMLDEEDNQTRWHATPAFALKPGDVVTLTAHPDGGEPCRTRAVTLVRADASGGARCGRGRVAYQPVGLEALDSAALLGTLAPQAVLADPGEVMVNVMDVPAMGLTTVHLVNYGLEYEVANPGLYTTDDGTPEARVFFGGEGRVVRKRITIGDLDEVADPVLQVHGFGIGEADAALAVTINGQPAARIAHADFAQRSWHEVPIPRDLLTDDNTIEIRAEGELDGVAAWIQIDIDTDTNEGGSSLSSDGGNTFSADDLSPDLKDQTGEYMIRIKDRSPGQFDEDPANLVQNPGFEQVVVPHSETQITVPPAEGFSVLLDGEAQTCLAISPDGPPQWVEPMVVGKAARYTAPTFSYYSILLLGERATLEPIRLANAQAAPWELPMVTTPLRADTTGWGDFGAGFAFDETGGREGGRAITITNQSADDIRGASQQFAFEGDDQPTALTISAWSRCENVSEPGDGHYSVWVDALCEDGTVYNGHSARFPVGTHDWQQATLTLDPPAPIRTMKLFVLFRHHSGTVWFDDIRMEAR